MPVIHTTKIVQIGNVVSMTPVDSLKIEEVVERIERLNTQLATFWSKSDGWAPVHAAGLLGKSRLDWQASLSSSLKLWVGSAKKLSDGELILAWTNLGSLIEGSIKLLLAVYYETYKADVENLKKANAFDHKKAEAHSPDGLTLEPLRKYCSIQKILEPSHLALMELVQQRRNAIHAFKDRPIGNDQEFRSAIRDYLTMLREIVRRLPYPDDVYVPQE